MPLAFWRRLRFIPLFQDFSFAAVMQCMPPPGKVWAACTKFAANSIMAESEGGRLPLFLAPHTAD